MHSNKTSHINLTPIQFNHQNLLSPKQNKSWRKYPQLFNFLNHVDKNSIQKETAQVDTRQAKQQRKNLQQSPRPHSAFTQSKNNNISKISSQVELVEKEPAQDQEKIKTISNAKDPFDLKDFKGINGNKISITEYENFKRNVLSPSNSKQNKQVKSQRISFSPDLIKSSNSEFNRKRKLSPENSKLNDSGFLKIGNFSPELSKVFINPFTPQVIVKRKQKDLKKQTYNTHDLIKTQSYQEQQVIKQNTIFNNLDNFQTLTQSPQSLKTCKHQKKALKLTIKDQGQKKTLLSVRTSFQGEASSL